MSLENKLKRKTAVVGIVGLGYVGLPLSLAFSEAGIEVLGFDIRQNNVDSINKGKSYIADVTNKRVALAVKQKLLEATTDQSRLQEVDAICVCVPTPLTKTKDPDLSYVIYESEQISNSLRKGQLVVLESTTYPGTTSEVMLPILERSGLRGGKDFYLAYSPERVDPGSKNYSIKNTPKLVGGIDKESTKLAEILYSMVADSVVRVTSPEVAEMTKLFENVFRSVNIALVNELAMLCGKMGISIWEVIDTASTKPFGFMPFYPGPGIGGHCIPLDPYYLANKAREYNFHTRFIELAADINEQMPSYVVSRIIDMLNLRRKNVNGAKILMLGIAYKKDVGDIRESPALRIMRILNEKGATICFNDPFIGTAIIDGVEFSSIQLSDELIHSMDCVIITTDHSSYDYPRIVRNAALVFDTRGATKNIDNDKIIYL